MSKTFSDFTFSEQIGIIALHIKSRGGNNADVAEALRMAARRYDARANDERRDIKRQGELY